MHPESAGRIPRRRGDAQKHGPREMPAARPEQRQKGCRREGSGDRRPKCSGRGVLGEKQQEGTEAPPSESCEVPRETESTPGKDVAAEQVR